MSTWLNDSAMDFKDFKGLFAILNLTRGMEEYERGKEILYQLDLVADTYEQAVKELAKWCEV